MLSGHRRGGRVPRICDPGCDCDRCETERLERDRPARNASHSDAGGDELNDAAGCGPWMILFVGFIVALTAIGVSLVIVFTELNSTADVANNTDDGVAELANAGSRARVAPERAGVDRSAQTVLEGSSPSPVNSHPGNPSNPRSKSFAGFAR